MEIDFTTKTLSILTLVMIIIMLLHLSFTIWGYLQLRNKQGPVGPAGPAGPWPSIGGIDSIGICPCRWPDSGRIDGLAMAQPRSDCGVLMPRVTWPPS